MLFAEDNVSVFRSSFSDDDIADGEGDSPDEGNDNEEDKVDLKALADEVYNLMKQELKQERQRLGNKR
jgi:hypothetical protein